MFGTIKYAVISAFIANAWGWQFPAPMLWLQTKFPWFDRKPFNCTFCMAFWIGCIFMAFDLENRILLPIIAIVISKLYYDLWNKN